MDRKKITYRVTRGNRGHKSELFLWVSRLFSKQHSKLCKDFLLGFNFTGSLPNVPGKESLTVWEKRWIKKGLKGRFIYLFYLFEIFRLNSINSKII